MGPLKRSVGVYDLTSIPDTLEFELNIFLCLAFAGHQLVPITIDSLQTLKQIKFNLRHLLPVDEDVLEGRNDGITAATQLRWKIKKSSACHHRFDSGISMCPSKSQPEINYEEDESLCVELNECHQGSRMYELIEEGDTLLVDLVTSNDTTALVSTSV
jgi:hypothetical protein